MLTRFAQRLRILRKAMQYSMDTFVALYNAKYETKMTKHMLARYEKGEQMPSYTALLNLADFFHVTVDYLTGRDVPVPTANTPETNTPSLAEPPITPMQPYTPHRPPSTSTFATVGTHTRNLGHIKTPSYTYALYGDGQTILLSQDEYNALKSVLNALRGNIL